MLLNFKTSLISLLIASTMGITACTDKQVDSASETSTEASDSSESAMTSNVDQKDVVTLRFSHFWPSTAAMHTDVFEAWGKKVEADSQGRIKVEMYPSATLSKPAVTYDAATKGIVDIGVQAQGYTAGRFPLTQIAELPGLSNSAGQMSCMLQKLYDDGVISSEYDDTHLLFMMGAGPGVLHSIDKPIRTPDDMKGMRIRRPSAIAGDIIEASGGSPVGLPAPDLYTSLERGVIDGMSLPWSPTGSFRLTELVNNHTNMPFYSSSLLVTMNKDKYESLPDDLKQVIDKNSGKVMADLAGSIFEREDKKYLDEAIAKGDTVIDIPDPLNDPAWKVPLEAGTEKYLSDVRSLGLDADGTYAKAKEASEACKS